MAKEKEDLWQELHDAISNFLGEEIKRNGKDDVCFQGVAAFDELRHIKCKFVDDFVPRFREFVQKLPKKEDKVTATEAEWKHP